MSSWVPRDLLSKLDRSGLSSLVPVVAAGYIMARTGQWCRVRRQGEFWEHHWRDGVLVDRALNRSPPADCVQNAQEYWCFAYRPQPGDIVVDVGAGIGTEAQFFSRCVGPQGHVYALEAHPVTFACLQRTVALNRLENVTPVQIAVSDAPGVLTISDDELHIVNRVRQNGSAQANGYQVPADHLDHLMVRLGLSKIDFLNLNIEGAERAAVQGLQAYARSVRHLAISCHDFLVQMYGDASYATRDAVKARLDELGFELIPRPDAGLPAHIADVLYARSA